MEPTTEEKLRRASEMMNRIGERMMPSLEAIKKMEDDMLLHGIGMLYGGKHVPLEDFYLPAEGPNPYAESLPIEPPPAS